MRYTHREVLEEIANKQDLYFGKFAKYVGEYSTPILNKPGFRTITKSVVVYKKTKNLGPEGSSAITSLKLKRGTVIYAGEACDYRSSLAWPVRKMRASKATVISNVDLKTGQRRSSCRSYQGYHFFYREGQNVIPREPFSFDAGSCGSGIHFFFNLGDALLYW